MKPFNLEKALSGEPIVTRDGRKITDFYYFKNIKTKFPIIVQIENSTSVDHYTIKGTWAEDFNTTNPDLFMADTEKWVNVYYNKEKDLAFCSETYESEIEARTGSLPTHYITTIQVRK